MPVLFDTNTMPAGDRHRRLRDTFGRVVVPVEIEHHTDPEAFRARCQGRSAGRLSVLTVNSTPLTVRRTPALTRVDPEPFVILELQRAGRRTVTQEDRSTGHPAHDGEARWWRFGPLGHRDPTNDDRPLSRVELI